MNLLRTFKHLLIPQWRVRQSFPQAALQAIGSAVAASEKRHTGELRFVVEGGLPPECLWRGATARERAVDLFSQLRVWDTETNSGILIYVQWVDQAVEILADRGIAACVPQAEWDAICHGMEAAFRRGEYQFGALAAIERASQLLVANFPSSGGGYNELPDQPVML